MDKNTVSGLTLMALVIFLFFWLNKPSQQEIEAQRAAQEQIAEQAMKSAGNADAQGLNLLSPQAGKDLAAIVRQNGTPDASNPGIMRLVIPAAQLALDMQDSLAEVRGFVRVGRDSIPVEKVMANDMLDYTPEQAYNSRLALSKVIGTFGKYKSFAPFYYGDNTRIVIENDLLRVTLAAKGGIVEEVTLKKYKTETTEPATDVTLFTQNTGSYGFTFVTADQRIHTDSLYFRPTEVTDTSVVMSLPLAKGVEWNIRYSLVPGEYIVRMAIEQKGVDAVIPPSCTTLDFNMHQRMARFEKGRTFEERNSDIAYKLVGEGPEDMNSGKDDSEDLRGHVQWVAFKNQFFSTVIIPERGFSSADLNQVVLKDDPAFLKDMSMSATMPYSTADGQNAAFNFFFGPNDYPMLSSLDDKIVSEGGDLELNRLVPLGWGLFRWINQLIVIPVFSFLGKFISSYGLIIFLLTLFIKLILFPFTYKSYMSQAKMRVLAPEIKEINDKYPGQENAMKRQQETMALYSRAGASPFSGCLPMLLQMPVLIAMFAFFPSAIELRGQGFLWAHDLSAPDSILTLPFTIPWYGNHVSLFCLLMTVVNVIYIHLSMQNQPGGNAMPGMKVMQYMMPVMFLFFFNDYASGLSYYYFLSLLITIIQTYVFRHVIDEKKVRKQLMENAKKPRKKSGLMARLEEAQKKQEAYMREQAKQNARRRK